MQKTEKCSICGKNGVKLWIPVEDITEEQIEAEWLPYLKKGKPPICARCAERGQVPRKAVQVRSARQGENGTYIVSTTSAEITLESWKIDQNGQIPAVVGTDLTGNMSKMTHNLEVNFSHIRVGYKPETILVIPDTSEQSYEDWKKLPTR